MSEKIGVKKLKLQQQRSSDEPFDPNDYDNIKKFVCDLIEPKLSKEMERYDNRVFSYE